MSNDQHKPAPHPGFDIPHAHFGSPHNPPPDWRKRPDKDPDDDADRPAPESVRRLLGFNPHDEGDYK